MDVPRERRRILAVAHMLITQTDETHGLSMRDILCQLGERGIAAERKSIYMDLTALREFGLNIQSYQRAPIEYALADRYFSYEELTLLVDAVQSSRFLTDYQVRLLVSKVRALGSEHQAQLLHKELHVEGRIRSKVESVLPNVGCLQAAIRQRRQVSFQYCDHGTDLVRHPKKEGKFYVESPVKIIYSDSNYYLITYNQNHGKLLTYRVDRMDQVRILDQTYCDAQAIRDFDASQFANSSFSMYSGRSLIARLEVKRNVMNAIADRFGRNVPLETIDENRAIVAVRVMEAPPFFGWLAQFGTDIKILSPTSLAEGYLKHLSTIRDFYL